MNKKIALAISILAVMALTTAITFKALEGIQELDLSDPFEVDFSDE
jgi:hypothetical protein